MIQESDVFAHRRGLMLGLTLAEVLMLVLFILLLTYTAIVLERETRLETEQTRSADLQRSADALKLELDEGITGLIARLEPLGAPVPDLQTLELRLREITSQIASTEAANQKLTRLIPSPDDAQRLADALEKVPDAPPATEIIQDWLKQKTQSEKLLVELEESLEGPKSLSEAKSQISRLERQLDYFQKLLIQEVGNGLTYPPCWSRNGKAVFIYKVQLFDDSIRLQKAGDRTGLDLSALKQNGPELPMDKDLTLAEFSKGTAGLDAWSRKNRCRFYVQIIDATSPSNKAGYQRAMQTVENHFYKALRTN